MADINTPDQSSSSIWRLRKLTSLHSAKRAHDKRGYDKSIFNFQTKGIFISKQWVCVNPLAATSSIDSPFDHILLNNGKEEGACLCNKKKSLKQLSSWWYNEFLLLQSPDFVLNVQPFVINFFIISSIFLPRPAANNALQTKCLGRLSILTSQNLCFRGN